MHPRVRPQQLAQFEFGLFWAKLQRQLEIQSYEQGFLVLNQLERFWLEASLKNLTVADAIEHWESAARAEDVVAQMAGDLLVKIVKEYDLTYGEIYSALADTRATSIKYYIRGERHPDDPDKPGGLA